MHFRRSVLRLLCGLVLVALAAGACSKPSILRLKVQNVSAQPGDEGLRVLLELDNRGIGPVRAIQIALRYDPELIEIVQVRRTARAEVLSHFDYNVPAPGDLRVAILDLGTNVLKPGTGPVAELVVRVSRDAEVGAEALLAFVVEGAARTEVLDRQGDSYPLEVADGRVSIDE